MTGFLLADIALVLLSWWLARPIQVWAHEMGHASVVRLLTGRTVCVRLGTSLSRETRLFGVETQFDFSRWARGSCSFNRAGMSVGQLAAILLGGPAANFYLALVALAVVGVWPETVLCMVPWIFYGLKIGLLSLGIGPLGASPVESDGSALRRILRA